MATKKYEGMRIMSLEGSVLYKNEGFSATKNGKLNPGAFRGVLDESLDTLKLAEVYDQHEREIGYPYLDGKKRFCRAVVNLSFNRAVKVYESYGNRYVLNGYRVTDEDITSATSAIRGEWTASWAFALRKPPRIPSRLFKKYGSAVLSYARP